MRCDREFTLPLCCFRSAASGGRCRSRNTRRAKRWGVSPRPKRSGNDKPFTCGRRLEDVDEERFLRDDLRISPDFLRMSGVAYIDTDFEIPCDCTGDNGMESDKIDEDVIPW